jgi:hypothetical protein
MDCVFQLGVAADKKPETVLKNVYPLIEQPEFSKDLGQGFALVLEEFHELSARVETIINRAKFSSIRLTTMSWQTPCSLVLGICCLVNDRPHRGVITPRPMLTVPFHH